MAGLGAARCSLGTTCAPLHASQNSLCSKQAGLRVYGQTLSAKAHNLHHLVQCVASTTSKPFDKGASPAVVDGEEMCHTISAVSRRQVLQVSVATAALSLLQSQEAKAEEASTLVPADVIEVTDAAAVADEVAEVSGLEVTEETLPVEPFSETGPGTSEETAEAVLEEETATVVAEELEPARSNVFDQIATAVQVDEINACEYVYPLALPSGASLSWAESRKPERYSSAAPLSADARLRIVSERLNLSANLVFSVYVSPPNPAFLPADVAQSDWATINVARSFLADKNSPRMSLVQRLQETVVLSTKVREVDGKKYFYYEFLNSKSPTFVDGSKDVFRHSLAVTAEREGYLYTMSVSTLDSKWDEVEEVARAAVDSFRLVAPTQEFVAPWKDPWRFW